MSIFGWLFLVYRHNQLCILMLYPATLPNLFILLQQLVLHLKSGSLTGPSQVPHPCTAAQEVSQGNFKVQLICVLSSRDHYISFPDVRCLKNHFFYIFHAYFGSFQADRNSSPYYYILSERGKFQELFTSAVRCSGQSLLFWPKLQEELHGAGPPQPIC